MRNLLNCTSENLLKTENISIREFMGTIDEVGKLLNIDVDEYDFQKVSPFEWYTMVLNYMGRKYATESRIEYYLQFMDKYNGIHSEDPMYPTLIFHENETRNNVLLGAYNFFYFVKEERENLLENQLNV
tara:strand:+ start:639 stop:1025 length:387 start_codon:yes stop_codon:yes gene_type:complete